MICTVSSYNSALTEMSKSGTSIRPWWSPITMTCTKAINKKKKREITYASSVNKVYEGDAASLIIAIPLINPSDRKVSMSRSVWID